jgi:hypothetical protein
MPFVLAQEPLSSVGIHIKLDSLPLMISMARSETETDCPWRSDHKNNDGVSNLGVNSVSYAMGDNFFVYVNSWEVVRASGQYATQCRLYGSLTLDSVPTL